VISRGRAVWIAAFTDHRLPLTVLFAVRGWGSRHLLNLGNGSTFLQVDACGALAGCADTSADWAAEQRRGLGGVCETVLRDLFVVEPECGELIVGKLAAVEQDA
jgi:hypothetical protein